MKARDYDPSDRRFCSNCHAHPVIERVCTCSDEQRTKHETWRKTLKRQGQS